MYRPIKAWLACISKEKPDVQHLTSVSPTEDFALFDNLVPVLCELAIGQAFAMYRMVINLRGRAHNEHANDISSITRQISAAWEMLKLLDSTYGSWIQHCLDSFAQLSANSQLSAGTQ